MDPKTPNSYLSQVRQEPTVLETHRSNPGHLAKPWKNSWSLASVVSASGLLVPGLFLLQEPTVPEWRHSRDRSLYAPTSDPPMKWSPSGKGKPSTSHRCPHSLPGSRDFQGTVTSVTPMEEWMPSDTEAGRSNLRLTSSVSTLSEHLDRVQ